MFLFFAGNIEGASLLLKYGADPTKRGKVKSVSDNIDIGTKFMSPLFVFLYSPQGFMKPNSLPSSTGKIAHLVDAGYFSTADITRELHSYIDEEFQSFEHLKMFGNQLVNLMFGRTTASLRQLCVRNIFQSCFVKVSDSKLTQLEMEDKLRQQEIDPISDLSLSDRVTYWRDVITTDSLDKLITKLSLPTDSLVYFETELFTHQLSSTFCLFRYPDDEYEHVLEWFSESDELTSNEEGESDIEYW